MAEDRRQAWGAWEGLADSSMGPPLLHSPTPSLRPLGALVLSSQYTSPDGCKSPWTLKVKGTLSPRCPCTHPPTAYPCPHPGLSQPLITSSGAISPLVLPSTPLPTPCPCSLAQPPEAPSHSSFSCVESPRSSGEGRGLSPRKGGQGGLEEVASPGGSGGRKWEAGWGSSVDFCSRW